LSPEESDTGDDEEELSSELAVDKGAAEGDGSDANATAEERLSEMAMDKGAAEFDVEEALHTFVESFGLGHSLGPSLDESSGPQPEAVGEAKKKLSHGTAPKMKAELSRRSLPTSGRKADFIARLREGRPAPEGQPATGSGRGESSGSRGQKSGRCLEQYSLSSDEGSRVEGSQQRAELAG